MSAAAQAPPATGEANCARCGSPLADDQEWCLECGTARTLIHGAPDWRVPLVIVGAVFTLILAGAVVALVALSSDANRLANAQPAKSHVASTAAPSPTPTTPSPASTPPPAPTVSIPDWPVGLGGWTVVLGTSATAAEADATATRIGATGVPVGVLDSSQHPSLRPGFWVVFSGRYPAGAQARAAAVRLRASGQSQARAKLVAPPGGQ